MPYRATRYLLLSILALLMLMLTGCSQTLELTLSGRDQWQLEVTLDLGSSPEVMESFMDEANSDEFQIPFDASFVDFAAEITFNALVDAYRQEGFQAEWHRQGDYAYYATVQGEGYQGLERALNMNTAEMMQDFIPAGTVTQTTQNPYYIDVSSSDGTVSIAADWQELGHANAAFAALYQQDILIHGRRVISSNAHEIRSGTAIWHNPSSIEVTIQPRTTLNPLLPAILLGVLLIGVIVVVFSKVSQQRAARLSSPRLVRIQYSPFSSPIRHYHSSGRGRRHQPGSWMTVENQSGSNALLIWLLLGVGLIIVGLIIVIVLLVAG